ncbi:MAG: response regulator, partial [Pseudomonadota bacterium]
LLVTDVVMPRMGGPALAEQLHTTRPAMRVLYLSGYTDRTFVHPKGLKVEAAFLHKPFDPETLLRKVRELLDRALDEVQAVNAKKIANEAHENPPPSPFLEGE